MADLELKTSWRRLVQQTYPPQTAWQQCPGLPQNTRNNVTQDSARKWLELSEVQVKEIIELSCQEVTIINDLLNDPTTSIALVNDDRLLGGQAMVLCHLGAEQELDNLGPSTRTRHVQRRGMLNAPYSAYHEMPIMRTIPTNTVLFGPDNNRIRSRDQILLIIQILAPRVLSKIPGGLQYSEGPVNIEPVKRFILYHMIGIGIKRAVKEIKAIITATKEATKGSMKIAQTTSNATKNMNTDLDTETNTYTSISLAVLDSPKVQLSKRELTLFVTDCMAKNQSTRTKQIQGLIDQNNLGVKTEIQSMMEKRDEINRIEVEQLSEELEKLGVEMRTQNATVESRLTSVEQTGKDFVDQVRQMNQSIKDRISQAEIKTQNSFDTLTATLVSAIGIRSNPPPSPPHNNFISGSPPTPLVRATNKQVAPKKHTPVKQVPAIEQALVPQSINQHSKPLRPRAVQIILLLRHNPPPAVVLKGNTVSFGHMDTPITFNKIFQPGVCHKIFFQFFLRSILGSYCSSIARSTIVFCGQSGAGKTYSMLGEVGNEGFVPLLLRYLIDLGSTPTITASCFLGKCENEILKQELKDVASIGTLLAHIRHTRAVAHTAANTQSSREHLLVTIGAQAFDTEISVTIIDLAGQETSADRFEAAQNVKNISNGINKDLVAISNILTHAAKEMTIPMTFRNQDQFTRKLSSFFDSHGNGEKAFIVMAERFDEGYIQTGLRSLRWAGEILGQKS